MSAVPAPLRLGQWGRWTLGTAFSVWCTWGFPFSAKIALERQRVAGMLLPVEKYGLLEAGVQVCTCQGRVTR